MLGLSARKARQELAPSLIYRDHVVKRFCAVFRRHASDEALLEMALDATTIQAAIDEAKSSDAAQRIGAESLDILADGEKVETVGIGAEPFRT